VTTSLPGAPGADYANLFPSRVGRMALDANLDPAAWSTPHGYLSYVLREGIDEARATDKSAFLTLCGQTTKAACAFSAGTPAATHAKWNMLLRRLKSRLPAGRRTVLHPLARPSQA
jgi:hypothetical protein